VLRVADSIVSRSNNLCSSELSRGKLGTIALTPVTDPEQSFSVSVAFTVIALSREVLWPEL